MNKFKVLQEWLKSLGKRYTIPELKNLERLYLNSNNLTTLPNEIGELKNLKELDLHNNDLTTLPNFIGELKNLKGLNLDNNGFIFSNCKLEIKNLYTSNTTMLPHTELTSILTGDDKYVS